MALIKQPYFSFSNAKVAMAKKLAAITLFITQERVRAWSRDFSELDSMKDWLAKKFPQGGEFAEIYTALREDKYHVVASRLYELVFDELNTYFRVHQTLLIAGAEAGALPAIVGESVQAATAGLWMSAATQECEANAVTTGEGTSVVTADFHGATMGDSAHAVANKRSAITLGNGSTAISVGDGDAVATAGQGAHAAAVGEERIVSVHAATAGNGANAATSFSKACAATTGEGANAVSTGYRAMVVTLGPKAHAASTGPGAHAATTGQRAHATTMGKEAHAIATGNMAKAAAIGRMSIAASLGSHAKARASIGGGILLAHRDEHGKLLGIKAAVIKPGGEIKADTWYSLNDAGDFVEVKDDSDGE